MARGNFVSELIYASDRLPVFTVRFLDDTNFENHLLNEMCDSFRNI